MNFNFIITELYVCLKSVFNKCTKKLRSNEPAQKEMTFPKLQSPGSQLTARVCVRPFPQLEGVSLSSLGGKLGERILKANKSTANSGRRKVIARLDEQHTHYSTMPISPPEIDKPSFKWVAWRPHKQNFGERFSDAFSCKIR